MQKQSLWSSESKCRRWSRLRITDLMPWKMQREQTCYGDDQVRGLCLRVYGDDSKSFVFVYRIGDRQRFLRIGTSPSWSLKAARARTKELRSILDKGRDPAGENRGGDMPPPGDFIKYIAENLVAKA